MSNYSLNLPVRTASSHAGTNATRELFDEDRERQLRSLNKSGKLQWRDPSLPTGQVKVGSASMSRREFLTFVTKQHMRINKNRKPKGSI
jgi:hypothetical protein